MRLARAVVESYRRCRALTRDLGFSWPAFMRMWLKSWVIAVRTSSVEEARREAAR